MRTSQNILSLSQSVLRLCKAALYSVVSLALVSGSAFAQTVFVDQGNQWTAESRADFYTQDQGSRIMPLAWMRALKRADGTGFLEDGLSRFGYLPNPDNGEPDIPVGFTIANAFDGKATIGMTCSACHTRQINVAGTAYRIDGGPGIVDFQSFLSELDAAVAAVVETDSSFSDFANAVLGQKAPDIDKAKLKLEVETWFLRFHTLVSGSLPDPAWGPSRLDAVSMIFNMLAGLDIGEGPARIIEDNIVTADAPARYPFLWNAARQDKTQWPGFADNGNSILGLARNLGEVYGVFADFHPVKQSGLVVLNRDYVTNNSANFSGLESQEGQIRKLGPPKWPWKLDTDLAAKGKKIFERDTASQGCVECHGIKTGAFRSPFHKTWATPIVDVGTDAAECKVLARTVKTGIMEGAKIPLLEDEPLRETATAFKVLSMAVVGGILQSPFHTNDKTELAAGGVSDNEMLPEYEYLKGAFGNNDASLEAKPMSKVAMVSEPSGCAYEARVLEGIWAAAPYLHNGSVSSLTQLLTPAAKRTASFKLGPDYDIETVGLAAEQSKFDYVLETTDCSDLTSGNSRCGHEFGTLLSADEKTQLIEFLKSL